MLLIKSSIGILVVEFLEFRVSHFSTQLILFFPFADEFRQQEELRRKVMLLNGYWTFR
jgi:hypothetical protein